MQMLLRVLGTWLVLNSLQTAGRGQEIPELPMYFTTYLEVTDRDELTVGIVKEFYDIKNELFRIDYYDTGESDLPEGAYTLIHQFNLEKEFIINRQHRNCTISDIKAERGFDTVVEDGKARLASPRDLLLLTNDFNYTYGGVSTVRGVNVESWISYREFEDLGGDTNLTDAVYEIFFTRPEWKVGTASSAPSAKPIPWQLRIAGTITFVNDSTNLTQSQNISSTFDFFGFNSGEPDIDAFDTSVCVPPGDYYSVGIVLPVNGIWVDFSLLPRNIRVAVFEFTELEFPLQIGNIHVIYSNSTSLRMAFHISNISRPFQPTQASAYHAVEKLRASASDNKDGKLDFKIELSPGIKVSPILWFIHSENGSLYSAPGSDTNNNASTCTGRASSDDGLSDGAIAGIAIWMLVLGIGIGIMGTLCVLAAVPCLRGRFGGKSSPVLYKRLQCHEDDVVTE